MIDLDVLALTWSDRDSRGTEILSPSVAQDNHNSRMFQTSQFYILNVLNITFLHP